MTATTTMTTTSKKPRGAKPEASAHMPFFMTKKNAPNVCFTRGPLSLESAFRVGRHATHGLHSDLFADFPTAPVPLKPDFEHENKLLQEEVLRLESQLVTMRCDLAVKEFEILGLNSENQYLRRMQHQTTLKTDDLIAKLSAQCEYAQKVAHDQEIALRRQAREIEESKAWILNQYFTGCVDDNVPKPASWDDPNTLRVDVIEASASLVATPWASSFTSIATPLLRSPSAKAQQKLVSQLEDVENLLARCVEHQKASVSEVANIEMAMEEACEQYYHVLDEPIEEPTCALSEVKTDDDAAFEFDALISELNGLVCRYDAVPACGA
ncbi:hypothetical protein SPRG_02884 [Saprolegnia parasitica CBS 223.65]|uniref:Uncharacterized protein n=1 Tax=Saprolegnia parasitica (strain CBS 223.65) TaxID=695850 RepID=A0A067D028_SAPPC|nr:hypothetical protein SPRG_02884 [Saprolegnia parasitica CBS 223.65]KDO32407.1 hypothetical protein SPRG_02884 [Saprolegnia parasitica CBS 223.65]|eukprot:XP_012196861.1 hypothetical protein SPRG_02884 [Saprolegnia parasitica CBS 223.65]